MEKVQKVKKESSLEDKKKIIAESGLIVGAVLLLCYFFGFSYIWNTGYGSEASVNGWNYFIACITWRFKGTEPVYGNLAVPFNYYAKYYVRILAVTTTVSLAVLIAYILMSAFNIKTFHKKLEVATMVILYILAFVFLVCIVVALAMNGSKILPKYCNNNPQCSIATLAFFPFFITLITAIVHSVFIYKNEL
jgi:hypothetical protein